MKELKNVSVSFRVSPRFKECLAKAAAQDDRGQANFLKRLLFDYCEPHNIAPKSPKLQKRVSP